VSIEPPKTGRGTSGPIVILVFLSVLLLAAMAIFGMLAFNILPGRGDNAVDPATALTVSGFDVVTAASGADSATVQIDLRIKNTGDKPVENAQALVQCGDNGYVSAIETVPRLESEAETELEMQLNGNGSPKCTDPDISFSSIREGE